MANVKKMTKKENFEILRTMVEGNAELTAFIDHELELLAKKSAKSGTTKTQKENEGTKAKILEILVANADKMTISEIQAKDEELAGLSNQKVSALLTQLVNAGSVERVKEKKATFFKALID